MCDDCGLEHDDLEPECLDSKDGMHCNCWYDGEPCCNCGSNEGEISE
jgi:hypothetical protein